MIKMNLYVMISYSMASEICTLSDVCGQLRNEAMRR